MALLNLGLADAAIVSWDNKYAFDFWRPITAIREDSAQPDPAWTPLITTPPFSSYTSGHSTFSGAASTILASLFGDNVSFVSAQDNNPLIVREFTSFSQAAAEAADSRLYGGIHYRFDNEDGLVGGQLLGAHVANTMLRPVPEPTSLVLAGVGAVGIALLRRKHRTRNRQAETIDWSVIQTTFIPYTDTALEAAAQTRAGPLPLVFPQHNARTVHSVV